MHSLRGFFFFCRQSCLRKGWGKWYQQELMMLKGICIKDLSNCPISFPPIPGIGSEIWLCSGQLSRAGLAQMLQGKVSQNVKPWGPKAWCSGWPHTPPHTAQDLLCERFSVIYSALHSVILQSPGGLCTATSSAMHVAFCCSGTVLPLVIALRSVTATQQFPGPFAKQSVCNQDDLCLWKELSFRANLHLH